MLFQYMLISDLMHRLCNARLTFLTSTHHSAWETTFKPFGLDGVNKSDLALGLLSTVWLSFHNMYNIFFSFLPSPSSLFYRAALVHFLIVFSSISFETTHILKFVIQSFNYVVIVWWWDMLTSIFDWEKPSKEKQKAPPAAQTTPFVRHHNLNVRCIRKIMETVYYISCHLRIPN